MKKGAARQPSLFDAERVFLGWSELPLTIAASWLRERFGEDMSEVTVALPGARAGRSLRELLARANRPSWRPPRILTQGRLTDALVRPDRPAAGRLARTLAWEHALETLSSEDLAAIQASPPSREEGPAFAALARTLRSLHAELAPEGLDFERVAASKVVRGRTSERARWQALSRVQRTYRAALAEQRACDPHEGRLAAIEAGKVACEGRVVLVGIADMNHLLRRALERVRTRVSALVFAPEELAAGFDELGCLVSSFWLNRDVAPAEGSWRVADKPADQARAACDALAELGGSFTAEEITIGVADEEVVPYLEQRLSSFGIRARIGAGTPLLRTAPLRLLAATAAYLRGRTFSGLAELVRHPDFDAALRKSIDCDGALLLDAYQVRHLPDQESLRKNQSFAGDSGPARAVRVLREPSRKLLAGLLGKRRLRLSSWTRALRRFLLDVYGEKALDEEVEEDRVLAASLRALMELCGELGELPEGLDVERTAAEALELVLAEASARSVAAAPARAGEPTVELLGWLELALDEARAVVVTGFNEGRVPRGVGADAYLGRSLRAELGLTERETRLARDVYSLSLLCASRCALFVTGRRSRLGDPLVPSRLLFQCPVGEIPGRVSAFLAEREQGSAGWSSLSAEPSALPQAPGHSDPLEVFSVTSFRTYLESPYLFYLRCVLRLETIDDRAQELEPMAFGVLAHDVLRRAFCGAAAQATEIRAIDGCLQQELRAVARARFGRNPQPAVAVQIEQLSFRLHCFAEQQAQWAQEGWRVHACEWLPAEEGSVPLDVDGRTVRIRGRIDRVDRNIKTGRFAVLDYKTRDKIYSPAREHRRGKNGPWKDLQLPLYRELAREIVGAEVPVLGYAALGGDAASVGFRVEDRWDEAELADALETAREVVRSVRERRFGNAGRPPREPILAALCGVGLFDQEMEGEEGA
jgi:hypothetical protein